MTTKRAWPSKLKALKKKPRLLSPAECDELIMLLGGSIRPNHRPKITIFGLNRRQVNQGAIASLVFSFLENTEHLMQLENELHELESPDWLENQIKIASLAMDRTNAEQIALEYKVNEIDFLQNTIECLRPCSAKNRAGAELLAVEWLKIRGVQIPLKKIQNELNKLKQRAELKRLGLIEWRDLKLKDSEHAKLVAQQMLLEQRELEKKQKLAN